MHKSVKILGEKLSEIIDADPLQTNSKIAAAIKVRPEAVSRWRTRGIVGINAGKFDLLAAHLQIPARDLFARIGANGVPKSPATPSEKALKLVEFAQQHGFGPGVIDLANKMVKAAASQSKPARDKSEKKNKPK